MGVVELGSGVVYGMVFFQSGNTGSLGFALAEDKAYYGVC